MLKCWSGYVILCCIAIVLKCAAYWDCEQGNDAVVCKLMCLGVLPAGTVEQGSSWQSSCSTATSKKLTAWEKKWTLRIPPCAECGTRLAMINFCRRAKVNIMQPTQEMVHGTYMYADMHDQYFIFFSNH